MSLVSDIIELQEKVCGLDWRTKSGYFWYTFLLFLICIFLIVALCLVFDFDDWIKIVILVIPEIIWLLYWLYFRNHFKNSKKIKIAFAVKMESNSYKFYQEIQKEFNRQIIKHKLNSLVTIKTLREDINFESNEDAEKYILKKEINLLIWGDTMESVSDNMENTRFNIMYSYVYRKKKEESPDKFALLVRNGLQRSKWDVVHNQSQAGLIVVASNILESSLFILGSCLKTVPRLNFWFASIKTFEELRVILRKRKIDDFPQLYSLRECVKNKLLDLYIDLGIGHWYYFEDKNKAKEFTNKANKLNSNIFNVHQNLALYEYLDGNRKQSEFHTKRAKRLNPRSDLPFVNQAFFAVLDENWNKLLEKLKQVKNIGDTNPVMLIDFIEKERERRSNNLGLLFYNGWFNINFVDESRGVEQINEFLENTKNKASEYELLIKESHKLID